MSISSVFVCPIARCVEANPSAFLGGSIILSAVGALAAKNGILMVANFFCAWMLKHIASAMMVMSVFFIICGFSGFYFLI